MKKALIFILFMFIFTLSFADSLQNKLTTYGIKTDAISIFKESKLIVIYMPLGNSEYEITSRITFVLNTLSHFKEYELYSIIFKDSNFTIKFSANVLNDLRTALSVQEKYDAIQKNLVYIKSTAESNDSD